MREVEARLAAKLCPLPLVYGPERTDAMASLTQSRIVFERERGASEGIQASATRPTNPRNVAVRFLPVVVRIYAQSTLSGARVHEHERIADQAADKLIEALRHVVVARKNRIEFTGGRLLSALELEERGLSSWAGVVYELRFTTDRSVTTANWAGAARPEATLGTDFVITGTDEIRLTNHADGAPAETAC